jgi:hypothetical protein
MQEYGMETPNIPYQKEVQISANSRENDVYIFLIFSRTGP